MQEYEKVATRLTVDQLKEAISRLDDPDRLKVIKWLNEDYCTECGAAAFCDCPDCVCECRKRRGREFREMVEKSGKTLAEWWAENGQSNG